MSPMMECFGADSLALPLAEPLLAGIYGVFEGAAVDGSRLVSCHFSPTHSPNPSLAPPGERGGLHVAVCLKAGNLVRHRVSASKWPQHIDGLCKSISTPCLRAFKCLQQIEKPLNQFDGNAPMRTFFPPLLTRPNVAVSSLSAPAGVERVGVRGGIQGLKNKNAADNRLVNSNSGFNRLQKNSQKQERTILVGRGLEARKLQNMLAIAQLVAASRELAQ
jgi:hypothetical protein